MKIFTGCAEKACPPSRCEILLSVVPQLNMFQEEMNCTRTAEVSELVVGSGNSRQTTSHDALGSTITLFLTAAVGCNHGKSPEAKVFAPVSNMCWVRVLDISAKCGAAAK